MGLTNFLKNTMQDMMWRGQSATINGKTLTFSAAPTYYVALVGGADFPNDGKALRVKAYTVGQYAWPPEPNGRLYKVTTAGTTGASEPSWPITDGGTVTDGTVVWTEQSKALASGAIPEPSGNAYARCQWICSLATVMGCNLAASASISSGDSGTIAYANLIQFPSAFPSAWGPIWGIALFDELAGGNPLFFTPMEVAKVVGAKDNVLFAGGIANAEYGSIKIVME
jgi:hypothetical protein